MDGVLFNPHDWDQLALDSLEALLSAVAPNGAVPASANTHANVYDHVYPRDASRVAIALDSFGYHEEAEHVLDFLLAAQREDGFWAQCYTRKGKHPKGAFFGLIELDNQGLMIGALYEHYFATERRGWLQRIFPAVERAVDFALKYFHQEQDLIWTVAAIHEFPPREAGFDIWVNAALCDGFRKASYLAAELGYQARANQWMRFSERIRRAFKKFWSEADGFFIKNLSKKHFQYETYSRVLTETRRVAVNRRQRFAIWLHYVNARTYLAFKTRHLTDQAFHIDICAMAPIYFQLLPLEHPQVIRTIEKIEHYLTDPKRGGIWRYVEGVAPAPGGGGAWSLGGHGPWSLYTAWLAQYHIRRGNLEKGRAYLNWLKHASMTDGKMSEHIDQRGTHYATDFLWGRAEFLIAIWEILAQTIHPKERELLSQRARSLRPHASAS